MTTTSNGATMTLRKETDSLGEVDVPSDKLWGAQTQRSLENFSIGHDLIPREMISAYAVLKKAAANANYAGGRLENERHRFIVQVCDEILADQHTDMFPLHVWMTGSGTQFNMNVNEVISNRCCQLAGTPVGSKTPVHPNDRVNMSQSSNDSFPTAMNIAAAVNARERLIPAVKALQDAITAKSDEWKDVVKIGRTHMQDATPITLGEEWSGYAGMLADDLERIEDALKGVYRLALGGTAVGTGINAARDSAMRLQPKFPSSPICPLSALLTNLRCRALTTLWSTYLAHYALDNDLTLKQAALKLGFVTENDFDRVVDPAKMVHPYVASASAS